jgi:hypothetical protein
MLASMTGIARFGGAIMFGAIWATWGSSAALVAVVAGLAAMTLFAPLFLMDEREAQHAG